MRRRRDRLWLLKLLGTACAKGEQKSPARKAFGTMPSASLSVGPIHLFVALGLVAFPPTAHGLTFSPTRRALVRDAVAASGLIAAAGRVAPSHAASVGIAASSPSFESLVQQQQGVAAQLTPEAAQARTRVVDPFAGARDVDPSRSRRFADELAPVSAEERRAAQARAVQDIYSTENKARPKALVSKDAAAPSGAVNNELSDEFTLEFDGGRPLGLKLKDLRVGFETGTREGTSRVLVADVAEGGQAAASKRVAIDNIVVAVDGVNVETASAKDVQARLARAKAEGRAVSVTFKDSFLFNARLSEGDPAAMADARAPIVTKVAPGSATQAEQVLAIRRLEIPERCTRNAAAGDLCVTSGSNWRPLGEPWLARAAWRVPLSPSLLARAARGRTIDPLLPPYPLSLALSHDRAYPLLSSLSTPLCSQGGDPLHRTVGGWDGLRRDGVGGALLRRLAAVCARPAAQWTVPSVVGHRPSWHVRGRPPLSPSIATPASPLAIHSHPAAAPSRHPSPPPPHPLAIHRHPSRTSHYPLPPLPHPLAILSPSNPTPLAPSVRLQDAARRRPSVHLPPRPFAGASASGGCSTYRPYSGLGPRGCPDAASLQTRVCSMMWS